MCELFTIGTAVITVMDLVGVASAAIGGISAMNQSDQNKSNANYQAAVARNNEIVAGYQADDTYIRGRQAVREHRERATAFAGTQRSILAASGFDANEDDALDILADTAMVSEGDVGKIRANTEREAWQHRLSGMNQSAQASLLQNQADSYSPGMEGGFAFGTGMAGVADKWTKRNKGATIGSWKVA